MLLGITFGTLLVLIVLFLMPIALALAGFVLGFLIVFIVTLIVTEAFMQLGLSLTTLPTWFDVSLLLVVGCCGLYVFWDRRRKSNGASVQR